MQLDFCLYSICDILGSQMKTNIFWSKRVVWGAVPRTVRCPFVTACLFWSRIFVNVSRNCSHGLPYTLLTTAAPPVEYKRQQLHRPIPTPAANSDVTGTLVTSCLSHRMPGRRLRSTELKVSSQKPSSLRDQCLPSSSLKGSVGRSSVQVQFLSRVSILLLTRDIDIVILSVRMSVCLSVTRWYCMKTA